MNNPALRVEPRTKPASIIPTQQQVSILDWLESTGRLIARESDAALDFEDDAEELNELMLGDDSNFLEDDDDDDDLALDDDDDAI